MWFWKCKKKCWVLLATNGETRRFVGTRRQVLREAKKFMKLYLFVDVRIFAETTNQQKGV